MTKELLRMLWICFYLAVLIPDSESKATERLHPIWDQLEEAHWTTYGRTFWPGAAVIFSVERNIGPINPKSWNAIIEAIEEYERRTCIRFKYRSGEKAYVHIVYDPERRGGEATIGRRGNEQDIILGTAVWNHWDILHEFGHTLGLPDEQSRPDRNDYIEIFFDRIREDGLKAYRRKEPVFEVVMEEPFDYFSVMMYDPYAGSKDKQPVMVSKTRQPVVRSASKTGLSRGDVKKISRMYNCHGNQQDPLFPFDVTCTFDKDECGFRNLDDVKWLRSNADDSDEPEEEGFIYVDSETIKDKAARFVSVNFHGLSPGDNVRGPMGCVSFAYKIITSGNATLGLSLMKLKSPHDYSHTAIQSPLWAASQATEWTKVEIPVPVKNPFSLVFRGQFMNKPARGVIGVDEMQLLYAPCANPENTISLPDPESPVAQLESRPSLARSGSLRSGRSESKHFSMFSKLKNCLKS